MELGLSIDFDPLSHVLCAGVAGASGIAPCATTIPVLPSGSTFHLQAVSGATCPWPVQSAVKVVRVQ